MRLKTYQLLSFFSVVVVGLFFFSPAKTFAANLYVRDGATGTTCTDWGANACDQVPAMSAINRGDTVYVADGSYGGVVFDKPTSGSSVITIKKANVSDHGTSSGWDNTYGDGQAQWGDIVFTTDYWTFDGVTGGGPGSWASGHGFKFQRTNGTGVAGRAITLYHDLGIIHHIQIKHCEFEGLGSYATGTYGYSAISGYNASTYVNDSVFSYNYIHNIEGLSFGFQGTNYRNIWEYNYSKDTCGAAVDADKHCEDFVFWSMNDSDFRYNYQTSCNFGGCSGASVHNDNNGHLDPMSADGMRFYGNFFVGPGKSIVCNGQGSLQTNAAVVQNTFLNITGAGPNTGDCSFQGPTYNNIYISMGAAVYPFGGTHDYNIIQGASLAQDWMHVGQHETMINEHDLYYIEDKLVSFSVWGDLAITPAIFVNYGGAYPEDYKLASHITDKLQDRTVQSAAGYNICNILTCNSSHTYNIDMFGNTFGADGIWDRGFAQYSTGVSIPPPPPPTPTPTPLPGDLNVDHVVNSLDWSIMQGVWLTSNSTADLTHDGTVNSLDFSILSSSWLLTW